MLQIVLLIAATASALPHLDIERVCRAGRLDRNPAALSASVDEYNSCVSSEHTALAALQQKWTRYPAKVRNECAQVVRIAPESSYAELQTCIESQTGEIAGPAPAK